MNTATETKGETLAQEYNASTVDYLNSFRIAAEYVHALANGEADSEEKGGAMDITEWGPLNGYSEDEIDAAATIVRNDLPLECDSMSEAWNVYLDGVLSIEATGKHDGVEWRVTGVEVTITSGGPNTWLTWNGSEYLSVRTAWGYDTACAIVEAPELAQAIENWADLIQR
jgi:hypothetical protein